MYDVRNDETIKEFVDNIKSSLKDQEGVMISSLWDLKNKIQNFVNIHILYDSKDINLNDSKLTLAMVNPIKYCFVSSDRMKYLVGHWGNVREWYFSGSVFCNVDKSGRILVGELLNN